VIGDEDEGKQVMVRAGDGHEQSPLKSPRRYGGLLNSRVLDAFGLEVIMSTRLQQKASKKKRTDIT